MAKPPVISAGVLAWRRGPAGPEFLLAHPGGPFWAGKDEAAWGVPKGLVEAGEDSWTAASREFQEELGAPVLGPAEPLTPCRTGAGKVVEGWLVEQDFDPADLRSNLFEMEWPPRSGRRQAFPEVDRAAWFDYPTALVRIHKGQQPILREAMDRLSARSTR